MGNRVLLISGNFYPEPTGIGKYSGEMIDWMSENGFSCTVITTFPYYPEWNVHPKYAKSRFWYKRETKQGSTPSANPVTIIRCPHYIPTSPTGFKRLLSEFTISFFSYLALLNILFAKKFDYVFTVAPPFELGVLGVLYKKMRGAIFLYHIQDLQIDAAHELGMVTSQFAIRTLASVERYIIKTADHVSTISEGMIKKINRKTDKEIILFPNWVNTSSFYPISDKAALKRKFGFKDTDKIILYSGAIGVKQGLQAMIMSAKSFSKVENVKFIICGSGPYKGHLIKYKEDLQADNVIFCALKESSELNEFLNMADIHLIIQKSNASDLMLPSKLSTILAVGGVAIVTAKEGTGLYEIMNSSDMGILIEPENQEALNSAIGYALHLELDAKEKNARAYAEKHLSQTQVLPNFLNKIVPITKRQSLVEETILVSR